MDLSQEMDDARSRDESHADLPFPDLGEPEGRTDLANARRFLARCSGRARYCLAWKKWLAWDGVRWVVEGLSAVRRMAQGIADEVFEQFRLYGRHSDASRWTSFTASEHGMRRMLAEAEVHLAVTPEQLDADPWLLNCRNGVLDLRTGELLPHDPARMLTKLCPVEFDANATSELWERTVGEVMSGDPEMIAFFQRLAGYFLTRDVREQVMPILIGDGANGKSTLVEAIVRVLGDYATPLHPNVIGSKSGDDLHSTERSVLAGRRLAIASETSDECRLNEVAVKGLTGGDAVTTRRMRGESWSFLPTHKIVLVTNHLPKISGTDYGIWRRLLPVTFRRRFSPEECDRSLPGRLRSEDRGILTWMVRGCRDWQRSGLQVPASVQATAARYRSDQDILGELITTLCVAEPDGRLWLRDLEAAASRRCRSIGERSPGSRALAKRLEQLGYVKGRSNQVYFEGLRLVAEEPMDGEESGSDETPARRDSSGKLVPTSLRPKSSREAGRSAESRERRNSRSADSQKENPIFKELRELLRGTLVIEGGEEDEPPDALLPG